MKMTLSVNDLTNEATEFKVQSCSFAFNKAAGKSGRATSQVMGGQINITLYPEVIDENGSTQYTKAFVEWMLDDSVAHDGEIIYYQSDNEDMVMKKVEFKKGFCVALSEGIQAESGERLTQSITISCLEVELGNDEMVKYQNMWQG